MNWIDVDDKFKPPINRVLVAYCPDWCVEQYQVCFWDGTAFYYTNEPNEQFNDYVVAWSLFLEYE